MLGEPSSAPGNVIELVERWFSSGGTDSRLNRTRLNEAFLFVRPPDKGTLALIIEDGGRRTASEEICRQIGEDLHDLRSLDVILRDLNPDNIYIGSLCLLHLRVGDFGLATADHNSRDQYTGTVSYLGPDYEAETP